MHGDAAAAEDALRRIVTPDDADRIERDLNVIGYRFMQAASLDQAREVLSLNTRLFPDAFNTWDSLGELQEKLGQDALALKAYERSLELNPDNTNAATQIERIRARSNPGR